MSLKASSEELLIQIRTQITAYQINVRSENRAHRYNINDRAEDFTIPLFKCIFGWDKLRNLNKKTSQFPGIDLADDDNRIAIQVTADTSIDKVKDTLNQFIKYKYYESYDNLFIFMIQEKQSSYSTKTLIDICGEHFAFDPKSEIIDFCDLMVNIKGLTYTKLEEIHKLFEAETGYIDNAPSDVISESQQIGFSATNSPPFENGLLNLIRIGFPDTIYLADWNFTKKDLRSKLQNRSQAGAKSIGVMWIEILRRLGNY